MVDPLGFAQASFGLVGPFESLDRYEYEVLHLKLRSEVAKY